MAELGLAGPACERVTWFYRDCPDGSIRILMVRPEGAEVEVCGEQRGLTEFVRLHCAVMEEQPRMARTVASAVERATGVAFERVAA
jgi:hypothetical protein